MYIMLIGGQTANSKPVSCCPMTKYHFLLTKSSGFTRK